MVTTVSDVVVPEIFTDYVRQMTEVKSRIIQSGAMVRDAAMDDKLAGGGLTFNVPSWQDLADDADNVSTDDATDSTPNKQRSSLETAVRLSRNGSWSSYDLAAALAGEDPMRVIGDNVSRWWSRRLQDATLATLKGLFADNDAPPSGSEHVQGDLTNDVKGGAYVAGVTDFTTEAFLDALLTMGDSQEDLGLVIVHSVVYNRMQKNNLIDFIPDSQGVVNIPVYLGRRVIIDDGMPNPSAGIYETFIMGEGAMRLGVGSPKVATEVDRSPSKGNGGGQETLYSRVEWSIHPTGHKYAGSAPNGGPSNAATTDNLGDADSWERVFPERKQIKIARLITRES